MHALAPQYISFIDTFGDYVNREQANIIGRTPAGGTSSLGDVLKSFAIERLKRSAAVLAEGLNDRSRVWRNETGRQWVGRLDTGVVGSSSRGTLPQSISTEGHAPFIT